MLALHVRQLQEVVVCFGIRLNSALRKTYHISTSPSPRLLLLPNISTSPTVPMSSSPPAKAHTALPWPGADARINHQLSLVKNAPQHHALAHVKAELSCLLRLLDMLQRTCAPRCRFHLLMETENGTDNVHGTVLTRSGVDLHTLFSPTITTDNDMKRLSLVQISDALHVLKLLSAPSDVLTTFQSASDAVVQTMNDASNLANAMAQQLSPPIDQDVLPPPPAPSTPNFANVPELYLPPKVHVHLPYWFPCNDYSNETRYLQDRVDVSRKSFEQFSSFSIEESQWLYRTFFRFIHAQGKKRMNTPKKRVVSFSLNYAEFTPPWIARKIVCGHEWVTIDKGVLPDLRNQKSIHGRKRLLFILAAFAEKEVGLARDLLKYILANKEELMERTIRPRAKRRRPDDNEDDDNADAAQGDDIASSRATEANGFRPGATGGADAGEEETAAVDDSNLAAIAPLPREHSVPPSRFSRTGSKDDVSKTRTGGILNKCSWCGKFTHGSSGAADGGVVRCSSCDGSEEA